MSAAENGRLEVKGAKGPARPHKLRCPRGRVSHRMPFHGSKYVVSVALLALNFRTENSKQAARWSSSLSAFGLGSLIPASPSSRRRGDLTKS